MSCPTSRMACDSEMVYWRFQPSWDFWVKDASCSPVDTEKTRRFLCWAPSSNLTAVVETTDQLMVDDVIGVKKLRTWPFPRG